MKNLVFPTPKWDIWWYSLSKLFEGFYRYQRWVAMFTWIFSQLSPFFQFKPTCNVYLNMTSVWNWKCKVIRSTLVVPIIRDDLISIQLKVFELKKIQELIIKIPKNAFSLTYFSRIRGLLDSKYAFTKFIELKIWVFDLVWFF